MKLGFFPYSSLYYKGAQEYLDKKAAKGLELRQVYLGCVARFGESEKPRHFVDLESAQEGCDDPMRTYRDYFQLCEDAGWELVRELRGMFLFRSKPGTDPLPIQTDEEMEWDRFWEKNKPRLRNTVVTLAAIAFLAFVLTISPPGSWAFTSFLLDNSSLLTALYWVLSVLFTFLAMVNSKVYLSKCKRANRVELPGRFAAFLDGAEVFRTVFAFLLIPCLFISIFLQPSLRLSTTPFTSSKDTAAVETCREYPVVMAQDLDFSSGDSRHLTGKHSLLCRFYDYSEITDNGGGPNDQIYILTTERYDCTFEPLARLVFDLRAWETRNGSFLWGELDWEETPGLGFEESYVCRDGDYLLLRQGKVVALVGCSGVDLTTPENLQVIRTRLDLPPD